jgi:hypothetical protein
MVAPRIGPKTPLPACSGPRFIYNVKVATKKTKEKKMGLYQISIKTYVSRPIKVIYLGSLMA